MTINQQLEAFAAARAAGAESWERQMAWAQTNYDADPLRWQIPWDEIDPAVTDRPGTGGYATNPGPSILLSSGIEDKYLKPAKEMWDLMEAAHDCWVRDNDPRALVFSWMEGIDPEAPNDSWWAHEEHGFVPLEAMETTWLAQALPTYTPQQWQHLQVVWTKVNQLARVVATFLTSTRELTPAEERLQHWLTSMLQVMLDQKLPTRP